MSKYAFAIENMVEIIPLLEKSVCIQGSQNIWPIIKKYIFGDL
jgi:hypothetical protein